MELPKRSQNRLCDYDYSTAGAYFITICTENRKNIFWEHVGATIGRPENVPLAEMGKYLRNVVEQIPARYPAISVDHYVIMPNHLHLLLQIHTDDDGRPMVAPTISTVVQQLKGVVSKKAGISVWQKGYYDHVVRTRQDYLDIWNYIDGNPSKWLEDEYYQ